MKRIIAFFLVLIACKKGGPLPTLPEKNLGRCIYTNGFSKREECRDYLGEWTQKRASDDCKGWGGALEVGQACDYDSSLGYCVLGDADPFVRVTFPGEDVSKCGGSRTGCEVFGGGIFDPAPVCGGVPRSGDLGLPTFRQPVKLCVDPKDGEPAGQSDGKVCTWEMISGATELGRDFGDYASCDNVRTQRPYYAAPTEADAERDDPRLNDPDYAADLAWLKEQISAAACVCCHSTRAPDGPANWYLEAPGNFLNTFYGSGLAMGAGWMDSVSFGAYPPEDNNGFVRPTPQAPSGSIFLTTDPPRMLRIFERELAARGLTRADFADQPYAGGPLAEQRLFRPMACENGEGVGADGALAWQGGGARYVYILEADAVSPTVPPNLDLPEGTLWRIDVPADGQPIDAGIRYGELPAGMIEKTAPAPLVPGETYYIYVLADILVPLTRCLFVAP